MTPAARVQSAIELLDTILGGEAAERALTAWGRRNRFAGSGDRAAIRDLVFDALRRRRSRAVLGGGDTGRGLMLGMLAEPGGPGHDADRLFDGSRHGPAPLTDAERARLAVPPALSPADAADLPDWALAALTRDWGNDAPAIAGALRHRAPVFLRVNLARGTWDAAAARLAADGITAHPHPLADSALQVTDGARRVQASDAYATGLVEVQDAASQAVVAGLPLRPGMRVLDFCAGGGGKALAILGRCPGAAVVAHDADPGRMADLPARAARAGVAIPRAATVDLPAMGPFDLVLCDAPCSGSGAWRRSPEARWRLAPAGLARLTEVQDQVLAQAAPLVAPGGVLAYATCSLFDAENADRIAAFLAAHPDWQPGPSRRWSPLDGGDGFFLACLTRPQERTT
ncbi:MAG: RsmB/NOP family class I SAM-dependent RNA methyltransferase [Rhodobacteraceae bacterium]|jgi:16S rRNA (cytosine967-C5)-methyltransferase|nr:RsmB/NOP family class I SAM-dependent RNA methyltransferase [Paracoccaceae bacterium]